MCRCEVTSRFRDPFLSWVKSLWSLGAQVFWGLLVTDDSSSDIRYCALVSGVNAVCLEKNLYPHRRSKTTIKYITFNNSPKHKGLQVP